MTDASDGVAKRLRIALLSPLLIVAALSWALSAGAPATGRSERPPLPEPVGLDFINESSVAPAAPPAVEPAPAKSDGLRSW